MEPISKSWIIFAAVIFCAWISYHVYRVMTSTEEYTERGDFGDGKWCKNCFETKEYAYLKKKKRFDVVKSLVSQCVLFFNAVI